MRSSSCSGRALGKLLMSFSFVFGGTQGEISFMRFFQLMSLKKRCSLISLIPFLAPMRFLGSL